MADPARARKLAVRIREVVASALERGVKDPRLGMVTVTEVRVTPDLVDATVFYTVYGDEAARRASAEALESARGLLRSQVGRATGVKVTPTLTFVHDRLPDDAKHLEELISVARERDARLAEVRRDARPAGDDDPYRRPRTADDDVEDDVDTDIVDEFDDVEEFDADDALGGDARAREAGAVGGHQVYPASPGGEPTVGR
ncbi:ribosome-binding factor A [Frankia torreyi]|uniref:Ribosome-binding factor A n=1 Tax=Frankia torreyi TaxID=1856 RepID=A0A0D8BL73_9ACTN|nr:MULTISPECIES: 30S ribosome-binding factor RbfA [Frankia]KJE24709.1 ribosome-binding factor A [Frankia torreyi]KQC37518.1 ribosome-binding factor A [Frankia sp. ACN1ag]KQM07586.1 ribosome-binding factor A [Frankia sp. CpI1-P]